MIRLRRWTMRLIFGVALVLATLVLGGACDARRRLPDLKPWHQQSLDDVDASDFDEAFGLPQYLAGEERLIAEVREVEAAIDPADRTPVNRYNAGSRAHPGGADRDWNRSFEVTPAVTRGGALLVHGLTDSPYSMRAVADVLRDLGYYSLALRMPGHGTLPSGLVGADWQDWMAAVRMGARHVRARVGQDAPLLLVGYSNGGALVLQYALDAVDGGRDPAPTGLVLLSPMVGVTPTARLAWWISRLGVVPWFEKANWLDVIPEYNPFKYNSFPANAAFQTVEITSAVQTGLRRAEADGRLARLPPILTFQSIVDATVSTPAVVHLLHDRLPQNGSELVLFDVNHLSGISAFMKPEDQSLMARLFDRQSRRYRRVLVTNAGTGTREVEARLVEAGTTASVETPLGLSWPGEVFSLTHVAIPFPVDDPLYGIEGPTDGDGLLHLGRLSPRGERAVLTVGTDTLMRLTSNPFFPYVAERTRDWVNRLAPQ